MFYIREGIDRYFQKLNKFWVGDHEKHYGGDFCIFKIKS